LSIPDLAASAVVKRFADHVAVDSLSFSVERGSFFSILGPSGCGKTTLLRMIAGFIAPDAGDIAIGGNSMLGVAPNRRPVNMVFQQLALFPMMSVGENVAFGLARRGMGRTSAWMNCPAANVSGLRSRVVWCWIRPCYCWMNRSARWT
jgi:spermidine/putrescine transport system ATP-binding protein